MNRPLPRPWWVSLFLVFIALIIFSATRIIMGQGSIPGLLITLSGTCIVAAQLFKRAVLALFGFAFVLAAIALVVAIHAHY